MLSNNFPKSFVSIKVITSTNLTMKMHELQKNGFFAD